MMLVLGIETSCDETAAAVVEDGHRIRSNVIHSQIALHRRYRGVVPEVASRSHMTRILPIVKQALAEASVTIAEIDGIAVTSRPGMIGCLLVGMTAAKTLAFSHDLPLVGVDHIQAHLHAALMVAPAMPLPCLSLVASGGHTALYLLQAAGVSTRIGTTRDDAAGEALDKGAALLGLPYPGGPSIEAAAKDGDPTSVALPRVMLSPGSLDFSFSGVKTALLYHLRGNGLTRPLPELDRAQVADLAAAYQAAIVETIISKLARAAAVHPVRSLSIGGGVARNQKLRQDLEKHPVLSALQMVFPPLELCSDNAAMVAGLGICLLRQGVRDGLDLAAAATARR